MTELRFVHEGLNCQVVMTSMGHRCGYVQIPEGHPLHKSKDVEEIDVHGGITYSGEIDDVGGGWWVGFDCAHAGDAPDPEAVSGEHRRIYGEHSFWREGHVWTLAEVRGEVKRMAEQIAKAQPQIGGAQ